MDALLLADPLDRRPALPGGGAVGRGRLLDLLVHGVGDLVEAVLDGRDEVPRDVGAGQLAVELGAVVVVRADEVVAEHGARYQSGDGGVEAGRGDQEVLAGAVGAHARAGVGEDRDLRVEAGEPGQGVGQLAGDGALAGPAVHEDHVRRLVVRGQPAQRVGVDAPAAHDGDRVVRQLRAVPVTGPAPHEDTHRGAGPRQRHQHGPWRALGEDQLGDGADRPRDPRDRPGEGVPVQLLVLLGRLVLDRQGLGVVGPATLDGLLALLHGRLQPHGGEVLEQPADVVRLVRGEVGATQGRGQHRGLLPVGGAGYGGVGGDDGEGHPGRGGGELGEEAAGGVQGRGVGGAVDDGEDGVEAAARDVVGVPLAGPVGRVVVGGEGQAGADGVAGVVHGEHR